MSEIAPCRGCPDREIGCHARCPKYIAFARWIKEKHAAERRAQERCREASRALNFDPKYEKLTHRKRGK